MSDIALRAGVSRPTVSVILNQRDKAAGISAGTRQRVLDAVAELGYRRNELARAVGSGQNRMIGFLATSPDVEFIAKMMVGALDEAEKSNYTLKILHMHANILDEHVINRCLELRLAAIISIHVNNDTSLANLRRELTPQGIPIAVVDSSYPQNWGIRVISDDEAGAVSATNHLIGLGHRRIAYLGGPPESGSSPLREHGFRRAMKESGLPVEEENVNNAQVSTSDVNSGRAFTAEAARITRELLSRPAGQIPTAIFCYSDHLALAVMQTAHGLGVRIPEQFSVIGFGNLARTELAYPPLTTVEQPFYQMGALAVQTLLDRIQFRIEEADNEASDVARKTDAPSEHILETQLVIRESTARCAEHEV